MALKNMERKLIHDIPHILDLMKEHIKSEHYREPTVLQRITIPSRLWSDEEQQANGHIRPKIKQMRNNSRLTQYINGEYGIGTQVIMTCQISKEEIQRAINALQNRKSVGKDGIAAETIKQNITWLMPIFEILLQNCQKSQALPKQWLRGIMTYIPKTKR